MKFLRKFTLGLCLAISCCVTSANAQTFASKPSPDLPAIKLDVSGEVDRPRTFTAVDFAKLPRQIVRTKDHGTEAVFEGVPLVEVLKLVGVEFGETLRGKRLEMYLIVEAADNYKAVFALPELDPAFTDQIILLADKRGGKPLSEKEGALRVIVPNEKRAARWVRQVVRLVVKSNCS